jgi:hypothetical protein
MVRRHPLHVDSNRNKRERNATEEKLSLVMKAEASNRFHILGAGFIIIEGQSRSGTFLLSGTYERIMYN